MKQTSTITTVDTWLANATRDLKLAGILSAQLDAELLACLILHKSRPWLHAHGNTNVGIAELKQLNNVLLQRRNNQPIAYITGSKEFYGRNFIVNSSVLVPRPESEAIIELATSIKTKGLHVLDIGTGSGCLGITLSLEMPSWSVTLTDMSAKALETARENIKLLQATVEDCREQDLLHDDATAYDLIVVNLPYVPSSLRGNSDISSEPALALFAGVDGLDLYKRFFNQLALRAQEPCHIITESLITQHAELGKTANAVGYELEKTLGLCQHFTLSKNKYLN